VSPGAHPRPSLSEPCKPICAFKARTPLVAQARRGPISEQSSQAVVRRGKRLPRQTRTLTRAKGAPSHPIAWGSKAESTGHTKRSEQSADSRGPEQTSSPRQCALHPDRNPQPTTYNSQYHSILSNAHRQRTRCSLLPLYPHRHGCHPDGLSRFEIPCRTTSDDQLLILTQPHHRPANHHHKEDEHSSIHSGSSPEHLPLQGHSCLATTADTGLTCPNTSRT
jgi:hypothetical protein